MKYSDLVDFEPVEDIIQLRLADEEKEARQMVRTYVVSDRLADQLETLVIPQLQFGEVQDNKGVLVVGNYGTGKSHLMALLSAVAEHEDLANEVNNKAVAKAAETIAGKFQVIRVEIGAVQMGLRDIICNRLEDGLDKLGVEFAFPPLDEIENNKDSFIEMMAAFNERYPDQGLLLVVDELLDYLRARKDQELILDLGFLREVGEVCKTTRFRFVAGVQESLFDNPEFQFVSESLIRVRDRFEQLRIAREDVAFVVAERLLKKTSEQEGMIREHLREFAPLYGSMNERLDDYVRLFPVHPAYLETFEQVYVAEKREVLKTLSRSIKAIVDDEVPEDRPGVISYDDYWSTLVDNPSFRSIPEIKEVIERSDVIESRVENAFPVEDRKPIAKRIIHGLSVHRLTTKDIYAPIGPTAEELRDNLCLLLPVPEQDAEFLKTMVEKVLQDIIKTASGQFISVNTENGQYYLDLKKDTDFEAEIRKRADTLGEGKLDRYYFEALRQVVLEDPDAKAYVSGYKIWEHDLEWRAKGTERTGYLFFGAPNERSTAQPPRDFYVYFLQLFDPPSFDDKKKADEVFFDLVQRDDEFTGALKMYAAAQLQADSASGSNKKIYQEKGQGYLRELVKWLRDNMTTAFQVTYRGESTTLAERVQGALRSGESESVRDMINAAASVCLEPHFEDLAPEYPDFVAVLITRENRKQAANEALRWLSGGIQSKQGTAVLDGLKLLDGGDLKVRNSPYAKDILDRLAKKGEGQVVNRSEILTDEAGIEYWRPERFRLEPELLAVVLGALVYAGEIVVSVPGDKFNAGDMDKLVGAGVESIVQFKHIEPPKELPLGALKAVFDLLGLQEGLLKSPETRQQAAEELAKAADSTVKRVVKAKASLHDGLALWGKSILAEAERKKWQGQLDTFKEFLEKLQPYNTAGKLKNFRYSSREVDKFTTHRELLDRIKDLNDFVREVEPLASHLSTAEAVLPTDHGWIEELKEARGQILLEMSSSKPEDLGDTTAEVVGALRDLKKSYQRTYSELHTQARLDAREDKRKAELNKDPRLAQLRKLASVPGMPKQELDALNEDLLGLETCFSLADSDLESSPTCPHCEYRPIHEDETRTSASAVLDNVDDRLDIMVDQWTQSLLNDLEDPLVEPSITLLEDGAGRDALDAFMKDGDLPEPVEPELVKTLQTVLEGLVGVDVTEEELFQALSEGGARCTVPEFRERFDGFVRKVTQGKEPSKVRIVLQ